LFVCHCCSHIGYALWKEENIHGIPHSRFELAEKNYNKLWKEICEFVDFGEARLSSNPMLPPPNFFAKVIHFLITITTKRSLLSKEV
jgi:hypothetical protein